MGQPGETGIQYAAMLSISRICFDKRAASMNGWQRLWLFVSVLWLLLVGTIGILSVWSEWEDAEAIRSDLAVLTAESTKFVKATESGPWDRYQAEEQERLESAINNARAALGHAEKNIREYSWNTILTATLPPLALYLFGWGVAWVRRGFAPTAR